VIDSIVCARHLGKTMQGHAILRDVSVDVAPGNVVGVIGKNGAGKTTLLEILLGFSPPTSGASTLFGQNSFTLPASVKGKIGFVPQQDELVNHITGAQQVALVGALHRNWDRSLIERLGRIWEVPLQRRIQAMSVGERQKLSTLLALGHEPELLVLDEPASSLDPVARRQFLHQILEIAATQTRTILFSTHIVSDLERVANQILIMRAGALVWHGDLDALKESVVRLNIHSRQRLPERLDISNVVSCHTDDLRATVVVSHWDDSKAPDLAQQLNAEIDVENLSLEDIFVELHA
jgi:ABC-2 type transport system ATP-binding protein